MLCFILVYCGSNLGNLHPYMKAHETNYRGIDENLICSLLKSFNSFVTFFARLHHSCQICWPLEHRYSYTKNFSESYVRLLPTKRSLMVLNECTSIVAELERFQIMGISINYRIAVLCAEGTSEYIMQRQWYSLITERLWAKIAMLPPAYLAITQSKFSSSLSICVFAQKSWHTLHRQSLYSSHTALQFTTINMTVQSL